MLSTDAQKILECLTPEFMMLQDSSMLRLSAVMELEVLGLVQIQWFRNDHWYIRLTKNASGYVPSMYN